MIHLLAAVASLFMPSCNEKQNEEQKTAEILEIENYPKTKITELILYPWIGVQGIPVQKVKLTSTGFEYDRCWFWIQKVSILKINFLLASLCIKEFVIVQMYCL